MNTNDSGLLEMVEALKVPGYSQVCQAADGFAEILRVTRGVAFLMCVAAVYGRFIRHTASGEKPDYPGIFLRLALVSTAAAFYTQLFDEFIRLCDYVGSQLQGPDFLFRVGRLFIEAETQLIVNAMSKPSAEGFLNIIGSMVAMPLNAFAGQLLTFFTQGVFYAIRFLRDVYLVALRATGPLFLGFYVHDKTRRLTTGWAEHVINVASWPIWMGLLVRIQLAFVNARIEALSSFRGAAADTLGPRWFLFQSIVLILMLLMIPTLMSRIVRGIGLFR